jgi:hypothetical protein
VNEATLCEVRKSPTSLACYGLVAGHHLAQIGQNITHRAGVTYLVLEGGTISKPDNNTMHTCHTTTICHTKQLLIYLARLKRQPGTRAATKISLPY